MSNSNKVKAAFLGMPYGTAMNRLRKQLLFKYVQLAGDDYCYACGERIETVDDLSVEHKEPWLNRNLDSFWDLDNIAFSHLGCNIPHTKGAEKLRKVGPEGTAWCIWHQDFLPIESFGKHSSRWNGVMEMCKECKKKKNLMRNKVR